MDALENVTSGFSSGGSQNDNKAESLTVHKVGENSKRPALIGGSGDKKEGNSERKGANKTNNRNNRPEELVEVYYDDSL